MPPQHCTNFPDIAEENSQTNFEQKDKIVRNITNDSFLNKETFIFCFFFFTQIIMYLLTQLLKFFLEASSMDGYCKEVFLGCSYNFKFFANTFHDF